jgi:hypothetical protein
MKYPCPCCGYLVFAEAPGSYDICDFCFWEDDISQLRFPEMSGGENLLSLIEAQSNVATLGASEARFVRHVRKPTSEDPRDPNWGPINTNRYKFEKLQPGADHSKNYPEDCTTLYYWRETFWLRSAT